MDELVLNYIKLTFGEEMQALIISALTVFESYEYEDPYSEINDILGLSESYSSMETSDAFVGKISQHLTKLLETHKVYLIPDATIADKVEICNGLLLIQYLENKEPIIVTLESMEGDEIQWSRIMTEVTNYDEGRILSITERVSPLLLKNIKDLLEKQTSEEVEEDIVIDSSYILNIKYISKVLGENNLGALLIKNNVPTGEAFSVYLPYIKESIVGENDYSTAANIVSLFLICSDCHSDIIQAYRKNSATFFSDVKTIMSVEANIVNILNKYNEIRKVYAQI